MFFLLPIGFEAVILKRWPLVSAGIALVTLLLFLLTWVFLPHGGPDISRIDPALEYWQAHPYLKLGPRLKKSLHVDEGKLEEAREHLKVRAPDDPATLASQQAEMDRLADEAMTALEKGRDSLLRKLSLVPERGLLQPGWITSIFVHGGWLHLLGNLLFFYISALLLEDRWGRPLFLGFYLLGGVVANVCQALVMKDGSVMVLGASGAIAACMGAFAVYMPKIRIRMFYFAFLMRVFTGSFYMAAWIAGALWFGDEVLSLLMDNGHGGVAFMAHVGGFAFGAAFAWGIRALGIERNYIQKTVEGVVWQAHPEAARAMELLDQGDTKKAHALLEKALAKSPGDRDLVNAQVTVLLRMDRNAEAAAGARTLLLRALGEGDQAELDRLMDAYVNVLQPAQFPSAPALRLGEFLAEGGQHLDFAQGLFEAAEQGGQPAVRNRAILQAAKLAFRRASEPAKVLERLARLGPQEALEPGLRAEVEALERELRDSRSRSGRAISLDELEAFSGFPAGVSEADLLSFDEGGLSLRPVGQAVPLPLGWTDIRELALAHLVQFDGRANVLLIDLVLERAFGGPATVVRLPSHRLSLKALYPGQAGFAAWQSLVREILGRSGAARLRPEVADRGASGLPKFEDASAFEAAVYGSTLLRAAG